MRASLYGPADERLDDRELSLCFLFPVFLAVVGRRFASRLALPPVRPLARTAASAGWGMSDRLFLRRRFDRLDDGRRRCGGGSGVIDPSDPEGHPPIPATRSTGHLMSSAERAAALEGPCAGRVVGSLCGARAAPPAARRDVGG